MQRYFASQRDTTPGKKKKKRKPLNLLGGKQTYNNNNKKKSTIDSNLIKKYTMSEVQLTGQMASNGDQSRTKRTKPEEFEHPFWYVYRQKGVDYWDYKNCVVEFNKNLANYELLQKIGRGKYSEVFRGRNRNNGCMCVLKLLKPVRYQKILREISILRNLCGGPNVVRLLDVLRDDDSQTVVLVTEYVHNPTTLRSLLYTNNLSNFDMRYYLYEILRSLDFAHRRGIFHRDIKPYNVMIDHERKILRVIDWGLGEYYIHGQALNCGVATRHYKGPELLVGYRHYDYSLDIWCLGCVLAGMLFFKDPFFVGTNNDDQLLQIVAVMGKKALFRYLDKYQCRISRVVESYLHSLPEEHVDWRNYIKRDLAHQSWCDATGLDLLDKMLQFDHQDRILAHEAMQHPFFAPVREALAKDPQEQYPVAQQ